MLDLLDRLEHPAPSGPGIDTATAPASFRSPTVLRAVVGSVRDSFPRGRGRSRPRCEAPQADLGRTRVA